MQDEAHSPLDRIEIPEPCPMAAELARGGKPDRRYCDKCEKHVVNLGALEKQQAELEVRAAQEAGKRLCVRMLRDQETGKVLTREDLPQLTARLAKYRPPQVAATLALAVLQWSCTGEDTAQSEASKSKPLAQDDLETRVGETIDSQGTRSQSALSEEFEEQFLQFLGYVDE